MSPSPIDSRVQRSKERVLTTTLELLTAHGLGGVSIDDIARTSGVAKTTIYRHWPTRHDLILDACTRLTDHQEVPRTGSLEGDLTALLTTMAALLRSARWTAVMPSIIDAAERDPALAALHSRIQQGHAAPFHAVIARAVTAGDLPPTTDVSALTAALLGPLYYRRWFSREPLDEAFVQTVLSTALGHRDRNAGEATGPLA